MAASPNLILVGSPNDPLDLRGVLSQVPSRAAPSTVGSGAVFAWTKRNNQWIQSHYIKPPLLPNGHLGTIGLYPMSIDGSRVAIGSYGMQERSQGAFIYDFTNSTFNYLGLINSPAPEYPFWRGGVQNFQAFGASLQVIGRAVVLGYPAEQSKFNTLKNDGSVNFDKSIVASGAVYVYE